MVDYIHRQKDQAYKTLKHDLARARQQIESDNESVQEFGRRQETSTLKKMEMMS